MLPTRAAHVCLGFTNFRMSCNVCFFIERERTTEEDGERRHPGRFSGDGPFGDRDIWRSHSALVSPDKIIWLFSATPGGDMPSVLLLLMTACV